MKFEAARRWGMRRLGGSLAGHAIRGDGPRQAEVEEGFDRRTSCGEMSDAASPRVLLCEDCPSGHGRFSTAGAITTRPPPCVPLAAQQRQQVFASFGELPDATSQKCTSRT